MPCVKFYNVDRIYPDQQVNDAVQYAIGNEILLAPLTYNAGKI